MPTLHERVVTALDRQDPRNGVIVCEGGRVLATRDPAPDGGCVLVALDGEPFRFPERVARVCDGDRRLVGPAQGPDPDGKGYG